MGNVVSLPLAGLLCQYGFSEGWDSVFYVIGEKNFTHSLHFTATVFRFN